MAGKQRVGQEAGKGGFPHFLGAADNNDRWHTRWQLPQGFPQLARGLLPQRRQQGRRRGRRWVAAEPGLKAQLPPAVAWLGCILLLLAREWGGWRPSKPCPAASGPRQVEHNSGAGGQWHGPQRSAWLQQQGPAAALISAHLQTAAGCRDEAAKHRQLAALHCQAGPPQQEQPLQRRHGVSAARNGAFGERHTDVASLCRPDTAHRHTTDLAGGQGDSQAVGRPGQGGAATAGGASAAAAPPRLGAGALGGLLLCGPHGLPLLFGDHPGGPQARKRVMRCGAVPRASHQCCGAANLPWQRL